MPLYMCNAVKDIIPESDKRGIAEDVTRIHCEVTGAPKSFVHVFFFEDAPEQALNDMNVFLFGTIRAGRSQEQKEMIVSRIKSAIHARTGIPLNEILVDLSDVPAHWVMEGGKVLPEPGNEEEWLEVNM